MKKSQKNLWIILGIGLIFCQSFFLAPGKAHAYSWLDANWQYRKTVVLTNTNQSNLTDFQANIKLDSENFNFALAKNNGEDIRFTDSDGTTLLSFWTEEYNQNLKKAFFVVKIPSILLESQKSIYLYYGNPSASSASNQNDTFFNTIYARASIDVPNVTTYDAFTSTVLLDNGNIITTFRGGTEHVSNNGKIILARSTDQGQTWVTSTIFDDAGIDDRNDLGLKKLADGTLILPFYQHYSDHSIPIPNVPFIIKSTDNGYTWSDKIAVVNPLTHWLATFGRIVELTDGTLLLPGYGKDIDKTKTASILLQSTDKGDNWTLRSIIAIDNTDTISYNETSVLALSNQNLIATARSTDAGANLYKMASTDGGHTWSAPVVLFDGVSPDLIHLNNGNILLCLGDRTLPDNGIRCHISQDNGSTWHGSIMVYTANPADSVSDIGYPSVVQLSDGNMFSSLYHHRTPNGTTISSILFNESTVFNWNGNNMSENLETGDLSGWVSATGQGTAVSSQLSHNGNYSLRLNDLDSGTLNQALISIYDTAQDTGTVSFWLYPNDISNSIEFGLLDGLNQTDRRFWFRILPSGQIQFLKSDSIWSNLPTVVTVNLNQWNKISLKFNSTNNEVQFFLNNSSYGTVSNANAGDGITHAEFASGSVPLTGDDFYIDDVYASQYSLEVLGASIVSPTYGNNIISPPETLTTLPETGANLIISLMQHFRDIANGFKTQF